MDERMGYDSQTRHPELAQIDARLNELRQSAGKPSDPFEIDDVEYLRLLARKLELGYATFNAVWFAQMAEKLSATLRDLDRWRRYAAYCNACAKSGEPPMDFDVFLARSIIN